MGEHLSSARSCAARSRRAVALGAVGATIAGCALALAAPASASTTVTLDPTRLDFSQSRYLGHNIVGADGVHVYTDSDDSLSKAAGYFAVDTPLQSAGEPSIDVSGHGADPGTVPPSVQLVTDFNDDGTPDGILVGEASFYGTDWWVSNGTADFVKAKAPSCPEGWSGDPAAVCTGGSGSYFHGTLDQWRAAFPHAQITNAGWSLGSGVKGDWDVNSITVADTTYRFSSTEPDSAPLRPAQLDFSQSRAKGHNVVEAHDIHVTTDEATSLGKAAGYFAVPRPALSSIHQASLDWTDRSGGGPTPGVQLVVDVDHNGTDDAILVGEQTLYGDNWWAASISNPVVKTKAPSCNLAGVTGCYQAGRYNQYNGSLAAWSAAFPNAVVTHVGYSLGSGAQGDGLLTGITAGGTRYTFADVAGSSHRLRITDLDLSDTRSAGHNVVTPDGLHVVTDDATSQAKAAGYFPLAGGPTSLTFIGQPELAWTGSQAQPGKQLVVDFDGDGTADGILVGEPVYGDHWWLSNSAAQFVKDAAPTEGGGGSAYNGTLPQWQTAFPNAKVVSAGYSLGSGVQGDGTIASITVADTTYTFENTPPVASDITETTPFGTPVGIDLAAAASDADTGQALTFAHTAPEHGIVTGTGSALTYTPAPGFSGTDSFTYAVTDTFGAQDTGTVTVTVGKAASTVTSVTVSPRSPNTASVVTAQVTVGSGGSTEGGRVTVSVGGRTVTGTVHGGKAVVQLGRFAGGTYRGTASFGGTTAADASSASFGFTVTRAGTRLSFATSPKRLLPTTRATAVVRAVSAGGYVKNAVVTIELGTKVLATAKVSHGRAVLTLPRFSAGRHTLTITFSGTRYAAPASATVTLTVLRP